MRLFSACSSILPILTCSSYVIFTRVPRRASGVRQPLLSFCSAEPVRSCWRRLCNDKRRCGTGCVARLIGWHSRASALWPGLRGLLVRVRNQSARDWLPCAARLRRHIFGSCGARVAKVAARTLNAAHSFDFSAFEVVYLRSCAGLNRGRRSTFHLPSSAHGPREVHQMEPH